MKKLFLISLCLVSFSTFAADDLVLVCGPSSSNGLGLSWAQISISQENPEASMIYRYVRSQKTLKMGYDYEGTEVEYVLTPASSGLNALNVHVKRLKKGSWRATLTNDYIDSFSVLVCSEK